MSNTLHTTFFAAGLFAAQFAAFAGNTDFAPTPQAPAADEAPAQAPAESLPDLHGLKRVFVDRLEGGESASQMRELIIAALHKARVFVLTDNPDRADAILRGAAEDLVYTDQFQSADGISLRAGLGSSTRSTSTASVNRMSNALGLAARSISMTVGDSESVNIHERKHEAMATVRLVTREGDVIWSTTQESAGGKFRGAGPDVAEKITRRLLDDLALSPGSPSAPQPMHGAATNGQ